jgi:hypothetical protein
MRKQKLRLDLDNLDVESFATDQTADERGTVRGNEAPTDIDDCWSFVRTSCGSTVWEAGCSFVTAALDCSPTEGGYYICQQTM